MPVSWPILSVLALAFAGYWLGRRRAYACVNGDAGTLHSRPGYHGWQVALFASVPALLLSTVWLLTQPLIIEARIADLIPETAVREGSSIGLVMTDVRRVASGLDLAVREGAMTEDEADGIRAEFTDLSGFWDNFVGRIMGDDSNVISESDFKHRISRIREGAAAWALAPLGGLTATGALTDSWWVDPLSGRLRESARTGSIDTDAADIRDRLGEVGVALGGNVDSSVLYAAQRYRAQNAQGRFIMSAAAIALALAGFAGALTRIRRDFRARNVVEGAVTMLLFGAASIAVLTTVGIFLSLAFNTLEFLKIHPASDFFLGLTWAPSFGGGSELGILPLLWGTLYISLISLAVAAPIGLFSAVYLSEYATAEIRGFAKPMLEVLAGIPTIVYGLFALLAVGPLLVSVFGKGGVLGVTWMGGGTAAVTAGLVMGIMLIPFVSSLSDDIINAVPQTLRDGSLALGATQSETVRQIVLPAALPGVAGAILLAASRAIGETMIVVLGAGAAARLSLNPFEAMTTVTAKIVSQLTGDADFSSPEAVVAFALGMTLFILTLGLNVLALYIVRRYREQYE